MLADRARRRDGHSVHCIEGCVNEPRHRAARKRVLGCVLTSRPLARRDGPRRRRGRAPALHRESRAGVTEPHHRGVRRCADESASYIETRVARRLGARGTRRARQDRGERPDARCLWFAPATWRTPWRISRLPSARRSRRRCPCRVSARPRGRGAPPSLDAAGVRPRERRRCPRSAGVGDVGDSEARGVDHLDAVVHDAAGDGGRVHPLEDEA